MDSKRYWRNARILCVDDDPLINKTVAAILKVSRFKFVESVQQSVKTIEKLIQFEPDLLLLDINMPDINGIELLTSIKTNVRFSEIKVIMLSSAGEESKWKALELGAFDYIDKPVEPQELIVRVRHALLNKTA